jgi:hypothetical protein
MRVRLHGARFCSRQIRALPQDWLNSSAVGIGRRFRTGDGSYRRARGGGRNHERRPALAGTLIVQMRKNYGAIRSVTVSLW